jgi:hypothetical protein
MLKVILENHQSRSCFGHWKLAALAQSQQHLEACKRLLCPCRQLLLS